MSGYCFMPLLFLLLIQFFLAIDLRSLSLLTKSDNINLQNRYAVALTHCSRTVAQYSCFFSYVISVQQRLYSSARCKVIYLIMQSVSRIICSQSLSEDFLASIIQACRTTETAESVIMGISALQLLSRTGGLPYIIARLSC